MTISSASPAASDSLDYSYKTASVVVALYDDKPAYVSVYQDGELTYIPGIKNVTGGSASDNIRADSQDNTLKGMGGRDILDGGPGADFLVGGPGADTITGGTGADRFVYWNTSDTKGDVITDFSHEQGDTIRFIFSERVEYAFNHRSDDYVPDPEHPMRLPLKGTEPAANALWYQQADNGQGIVLYGDSDGNPATHEIEIALQGVTSLQSSDVVFEYWN
jgi:hypothetical protein